MVKQVLRFLRRIKLKSFRKQPTTGAYGVYEGE